MNYRSVALFRIFNKNQTKKTEKKSLVIWKTDLVAFQSISTRAFSVLELNSNEIFLQLQNKEKCFASTFAVKNVLRKLPKCSAYLRSILLALTFMFKVLSARIFSQRKKNVFTIVLRVPNDIQQKTIDNLGFEACVHQVIRIKTSNNLSEIYFLRLRLLYRWFMLITNESLKLTSIVLKA